jgi:hypothetical protein
MDGRNTMSRIADQVGSSQDAPGRAGSRRPGASGPNVERYLISGPALASTWLLVRGLSNAPLGVIDWPVSTAIDAA